MFTTDAEFNGLSSAIYRNEIVHPEPEEVVTRHNLSRDLKEMLN